MRWPFALYRVHGDSMSPDLLAGHVMLVFRWARSFRVGHHVVFKKEGRTQVKRVQWVEGERVWVEGLTPNSAGSSRYGSLRRSEVNGRVISWKNML